MKERIILYLAMLGLFVINAANAQQDLTYTQYMFNMLPINPAYAGSRDVISMTALYRRQWVQMEGAPQTLAFSADAPIKRKQIGIGTNIINDRIGVFNNTSLMAVFSYKVRLKRSSLSFGMQGGVIQRSAHFSGVRTDENGLNTDGAFSQDQVRLFPNIGVGIYYSSNKYYLGISIPRMLDIQLYSSIYLNGSDKKPIHYRPLHIIMGYIFKLNPNLLLKPSAFLKYVPGTPFQFDLNCNLWIYDKLALGMSYRSLAAVSMLIELQATDEIRIGYAYDWATTRLNTLTYGGHEIMLRYEFGHNKAKVITPRYF